MRRRCIIALRWRSHTIFRQRVHDFLETASPGHPSSRAFSMAMMALISLNIAAVILQTVESLDARHGRLFNAFELFSVILFTAEYILRLWACTVDRRYRHPVLGRVRFALTPLAIVDLIAILPFYLPVILPIDLRFMRAPRLFRLLRILKLGRYSESWKLIGNVFRAKREELTLAVLAMGLLLLVASSLMYFVEHDNQPQAFSSIPMAIWWGVETLTTVGYGDVYPITPLGKLLAGTVAFLGIGMFALPAGILASGFSSEIHSHLGKKQHCPHCGRPIN
jgi:voltage-gated potassium channel